MELSGLDPLLLVRPSVATLDLRTVLRGFCFLHIRCFCSWLSGRLPSRSCKFPGTIGVDALNIVSHWGFHYQQQFPKSVTAGIFIPENLIIELKNPNLNTGHTAYQTTWGKCIDIMSLSFPTRKMEMGTLQEVNEMKNTRSKSCV